MATKHNISRAGQLYYGDGYKAGAFGTNKRAGVPINPLSKLSLGAPATIVTDAFVKAATGAEMPNASTKTYTTATDNTSPLDGGIAAPSTVFLNGADKLVWVNDVARNIVATQTNAGTTALTTVTINGYGFYGDVVTETLTLAATATTITATGKKAFKWIYSFVITSAADATSDTLNIGFGDAIGLPYALATKSDLLSSWVDDVVDAVGTVLVADTATATATTGDVRGTIDFTTASNGAKVFKVWMNPDPSTTTTLFGVAQF